MIKIFLFCLFQTLFFKISNQFILQTCCKYQSNFQIADQKCFKSQDINHNGTPFPKEIHWEFKLSENVTDTAHFSLRRKSSLFSCSEKATRLLFYNITAADNSFQLFFPNNGYLQTGNVILPPTQFCVNSVQPESSSLEIFACTLACKKSSVNRCLPKCCPWGTYSRWLHPELCYKPPANLYSSNLIPRRRTTKTLIPFYLQNLECHKIGRMVFTASINIFNETQLEWMTHTHTAGSYCIDDVVTSHDMNFDWNVNQGIFYCGDEFPVDEFGLNGLEKIVYGVCMILSTIFLIISIGVYYIKLCKTHSYVHSWIEFFYMICLLSLGLCVAIQVYFPEKRDNYCTIYHFTAVFGYTVFAVALFSWASLLSFDLFIAFKDLRPLGIYTYRDKERLSMYCFIGFSFPITVAVASFTYSYIYYWDYAGFCMPIQFTVIRTVQGVLLIFNTTFFICTFVLIIKHRRDTRFATGNNSKEINQLISCFIKLFIVSGITYGGIIFSYMYGMERQSAWYLICFRVFLNLRGVTIFFIYVCNPQMKKILCQRHKDGKLCECGCCKRPQGRQKFTHRKKKLRSLRSTFRRTLSLTI